MNTAGGAAGVAAAGAGVDAAGAGVDAARWICSSMSRMHCFDMVIYVRRWRVATGAAGAAEDGGSVAILLSSVVVTVVIVWSATTVDVFLRK